MFQSEINSSDPDHIYLDCIVSNNDAGPNTPSMFLAFSEIRDTQIIPAPASDWYLTISRFYLETPNLPVLLMPILTGQSNVNKSSLSITMTYASINKSYEFQQNLVYVPANVSDSLPAPPLINVDYTSTYYDIYSYQNFINMINTAFKACYNGLTALAGAGGNALPTPYAPYFEFDPNAEKAILNADILGYNNALTYPINIYFNTALFQLFSSFDASYYGTNVTNGKNYKLNVYELPNAGNVYGITLPYVVNYLQMYQEYPTLASVGNPISSIVFNTNLIPVVGSLQSKPINFNAPSTISDQSSNSTVTNMLTDIVVATDLFSGYKPNIIYNANPFRLISLVSNQPLRNYDISVYYKLHTGNMRQFVLSPGSCSSLKILFVKKNAKHI
jgi:hypothetical protein